MIMVMKHHRETIQQSGLTNNFRCLHIFSNCFLLHLLHSTGLCIPFFEQKLQVRNKILECKSIRSLQSSWPSRILGVGLLPISHLVSTLTVLTIDCFYQEVSQQIHTHAYWVFFGILVKISYFQNDKKASHSFSNWEIGREHNWEIGREHMSNNSAAKYVHPRISDLN